MKSKNNNSKSLPPPCELGKVGVGMNFMPKLVILRELENSNITLTDPKAELFSLASEDFRALINVVNTNAFEIQ